MELELLRLFQREVQRQCEFALMAHTDLKMSLVTRNQPETWLAIQTLLGACANISKLCWGQGGRKTKQRADLRVSLDIADDSVLRPTRFRNHFEHFDERLDLWWKKSANHNFVDEMIGPPGMVTGPSLGQLDIFRHLDPQSAEVIFWGDRFSLSAVMAEIQRIRPIAEGEARKPHWVPPLHGS